MAASGLLKQPALAVVISALLLLGLPAARGDGAAEELGGPVAESIAAGGLPEVDRFSESGAGRRLLENDEGSSSKSVRHGKMLVAGQEAAGEWNSAGPFSLSVGLLDGFVTSLSMILVSEIGDETFIIAALMAMRHPRGVVLAGALSALAIMTVLSTGLGFIVPNLISRKATNSAATVLYTFFGLRLLYIAWKADPNDTPQKEMEEVQEKLEEAESDGRGKGKGSRTFRKVLSRFCTPVFLEAFILTFLAEWGDRSQIATIALAAHKNPVGVTVGATLGHTICTSIAVVGGRLLALKISQRSVATVGGSLFLLFAIHSFLYPPL